MSGIIDPLERGLRPLYRPFTRFGLPIGGRSTAIKLRSGDVWVIGSTPLAQETRDTIDALGPVKYVSFYGPCSAGQLD